MDKVKIGWIGLGNMGIPMVKNLVKAGFEVMVYNRTPDKSVALSKEIKVSIASSPAALLEDAEFVITMLSDDKAVREIHEGPGGLLSGKGEREVIIIDMSTVSPATSISLSKLSREKGIHYMDAPVSGSVKPAEEGQLLIMAGGEKEDFDKAVKIFDCLGKSSIHLGGIGSGNYAKLAVNLYLGITIQGLAEAVLFAEKHGIHVESFLGIINNGPLGNALIKMKTPSILNNDFKAAFSLKHLAKDINLANEQGMYGPLGVILNNTLKDALLDGYGEQDMMAVLAYLRTVQQL